MTINRGLFVRNNGTVGTTPIEGRLALAGLVVENSPGSPRSGLLDQMDPNPVVGKSNMSYDVGPITAVVNRAAGEGVYLFSSTGTTNVTTTAAPATGSRYDLIYVLQRDLDKGDADNTAVLAVYQGTAASSPTKPYGSLPAGAYVLAEALVQSGATATNGASVTITQVWKYTALAGGVLRVRNSTERGELTSPAVGQTVSRIDAGGSLEYWTGSTWTRIAVPINGGAATDITTALGSWTVPFPSGVRRVRVWSADGITANITGLVQYGGGNSSILNIPAPFAPTDGTDITYIGSSQASASGSTSGGPAVSLGIQGGVLKLVYQSATLPSGIYIPLTGSWLISG